MRRGPREGTLIDAGTDPEFITLLLHAMHAGETIERDGQRLEAQPTSAFKEMPLPVPDKIAAPNREQSNTTVIVDATCVVKVFRKVNEGIHPEIEIGRFLIEHTEYRNVPDLLGSIELVEGERRSALAVAHRFVENQGDAWTVTGAYLGRFIDDQRVLSAAERPEESPELASYLQLLTQIAAAPARCRARWRAAPDIAGFRARAGQPAGHRGVDRAAGRAKQRASSTCWREKSRHLAEAERAMVDRMLAARERDRRAHPQLLAADHQRR